MIRELDGEVEIDILPFEEIERHLFQHTACQHIITNGAEGIAPQSHVRRAIATQDEEAHSVKVAGQIVDDVDR